MNTVEPYVDPTAASEVPASLDPRTLQILERRRTSAVRIRRGWLVRRMLVLADLVGLTLAFLAATFLFEMDGRSDAVSSQVELLVFLVSLPAWVIVAKLYGLYDYDEERTDHSTADDLVGVLHLVTVGSWLLFAFAAVTHRADPGFARLLGFWLLAIVCITAGRAIARGIARKHLAYVQNTIIVGAGDVGQLVAKKLRKHPEYGLNLVGFVDGNPKERTENLTDIALLGGLEQLPQMVQILDVERVIVAFSNDSHEAMLDLIRSLKDLDIQIDLVPRFFEVIGTNVGIHTAEGLPLIGLPALRLSRSSLVMKRTMDLVLSITGLILLSPLFLAVAVWIKLDSRGPVFFRQLRMGSGDQTFEILKFRTMSTDADERKGEYRRAQQARGRRPADVQDPQGPARHPRREDASAVLGRRAASAHQRRPRRDEPRRAPPAHPRRGSSRRRLAPAAAQPEARDHGALAGARPRRHRLRGDGPARLRVRDHLVAPQRPQADPAHDPRPLPGEGVLDPRF